MSSPNTSALLIADPLVAVAMAGDFVTVGSDALDQIGQRSATQPSMKKVALTWNSSRISRIL